MNWRNVFVGAMNRWYGVAAASAVISLSIPLLTTPTIQDPTGGAGVFAPLVAMCVAAMVLAEAVNAGGLQIRKMPGVLIAIGSMASAYLWMATESEVHQRELILLGELALLFSLGELMTLLVPVTALLVKSKPDDPDIVTVGTGVVRLNGTSPRMT